MGWKTKDPSYVSDAAPFVMEYVTRLRLAKLGFTDDINDLDCISAEALLLVDGLVEELKGEEMKKIGKKGG